MREATETELAYCAGIVDADGSIGVHVNWYKVKSEKWKDSKQPTFQPRCCVKQMDHQAVELIGELFGGHHYVEQGLSRGSGRPINVWQVHSRACRVILEALLPYLRLKHRQAELAIQLCDLNASPRRHTFVLPDIIEGEPMVPLLEAAERAGRSPATAYQSVGLRNIPFVKVRNRTFIPESYIETWRTRPSGAGRRPEITEQMMLIVDEIRSLNSGKRGQLFVTPRQYVA